ncbi:MAG: hypothetical protein HYZ07_02265, partial [Candidatus Harrisonbacteria bacterium]|nr:hypothetical protein [Candidatus Harrisonbacteria bacterium]
GIIAIAFATILRSEQYGAKKLLGKLIIVALLINFSLLIPGVILDGTHVFSNFFISKINGGAIGAVSTSIASAFGVEKLSASPLEGFNVDNLVDVFKMIANVAFISLFAALAVIAFGAVAYMVFYRYFVMTFLFILAPLAWISLFLPGFGKHWSEWWDTFFRWALFLPAMTFFIYLSIYSVQVVGLTGVASLGNASAYTGSSLVELFGVFGQMIVVLGFIVGGLMVAQKFGIAGASAALGMATGVKNIALGAAKGAVVGPAAYFGTRPVKAGAMGLANLLNKPALRWIPGAKGVVAGLSAFGQRKEDVEAYQKTNLSSLTNDQFDAVAKSGLPAGPVARAALLAEAAKRGRMDKLFEHIKTRTDLSEKQKGGLIEQRVRDFASAAKSTNPGMELKDVSDIKALLGYKPSLAPEIIGKSEAEATRKFVANDKSHELDVADLSNPAVVMALTTGHWKNLYENPKTKIEQLEAVEQTTNDLVGADLLEVYTKISAAEAKIELARKSGASQSDIRKLRADELKPWLDRKSELLGNPESVKELPAELKARYTTIAQKLGVTEELRRKLGKTPNENEIVLATRGKAYAQFENNRQQRGNPFAAFWKKPEGGGGGTPPTPPTTPPGPTPLTPPSGGIVPPPPPPSEPVELTPPGGGIKPPPVRRPPLAPQTVEELKERVERTGGRGAIEHIGELRQPPTGGRGEAAERRVETARTIRQEAEKAAAAEEARTAAAERGAEVAAKQAEAAKEELATRAKIAKTAGETLKRTAEAGKETEKILREVAGGAKAAEKVAEAAKETTKEVEKQAEVITQTLRKAEDFTRTFAQSKASEWIGATVITPKDDRHRVIRKFVPDPDPTNILGSTIVTEDDERITLRQLSTFAERDPKGVGVRILKKKV